jgi:hypothetical protein
MDWHHDNLRHVRKVRTDLIDLDQYPPLLRLRLDVVADAGKPTQRMIDGEQHALVLPVVVELIRQLQAGLLGLQALSNQPGPNTPKH